MQLDVSKSTPQDFANLFKEGEQTSIVVNNAGIMKNQKLLQSDPALLERMIKTNVHPYVYMSKYAMQHFASNAADHSHLNALVYVSSVAAFVYGPYYGPYASTKVHNWHLANLVRQTCKKSSQIGDLVTV